MSTQARLVSTDLDADGDTHAIYDLPQPVSWIFEYYYPESHLVCRETKPVSRVRLCLCTADHPLQICVVIVPYDEAGEEQPLSARHFRGAQSMLAGLNRIGFPPELGDN